MSTTTELQNWLNGTPTGGPNSDGRYPLTYKDGQVYLVYCPAAIALNPALEELPVELFADQASASAASAAGSAATATSNATAAAASSANAQQYASEALTSKNAAAASATSASTSATAAQTAKTAAEAAATTATDAVTGFQAQLNGKADSSSIGAANGIASLDSSGKVPSAQLPPLAIKDTFPVASEAAMLALTAEVGDVAIRTDINKTFILRVTPATTLANWSEVLSPLAAVSSVFGRTGAVVAQANDYTFAQIGSKPTTLSGYGITDAVASSAFTWANLGSKPTTIAGFGITDAVTTSGSQSIAGVKTFTDAPSMPHWAGINAAAGTARRFRFSTAGSTRWDFGVNGDAESGSNAGSNFVMNRFDDSGTFLSAVFTISRATGVLSFTSTPTVGAVAVSLVGHTHAISDVTNLQTSLDAKLASASFTWANLGSKPTTAAGFGLTDVVTTAGDQSIAGNKTFSGILRVDNYFDSRGTLSGYQFFDRSNSARSWVWYSTGGSCHLYKGFGGANVLSIDETDSILRDLYGKVRSVPLTVQNADYTFTAQDVGRGRKKTDSTARSYTINNNVFADGDMFSVMNHNSTGNLTIVAGAGVTLYLAGTSTTGNRTVAPRGIATIWMESPSVGYVSGAGVS